MMASWPVFWFRKTKLLLEPIAEILGEGKTAPYLLLRKKLIAEEQHP